MSNDSISMVDVTLKRKGFTLSADSMKLQVGESAAIVGANGSGKSTLLSLILNLVQPDRGEIKIHSELASVWLSNHRNLNNLGAQLQGQRLMRYTTVGEHLKIHSSTYSSPSDVEVLGALDIHSLLHKRYESLSIGEQQRCHLALALSHKPSLVFLDEPTAGLDGRFRENVVGLLTKIVADPSRTLVFVSHDEQEAALAKYVLFTEKGRYLPMTTLTDLLTNSLGESKCEIEFSHEDRKENFLRSHVLQLDALNIFQSKGRQLKIFGARSRCEGISTIVKSQQDITSLTLGRPSLSDLVVRESWMKL